MCLPAGLQHAVGGRIPDCLPARLQHAVGGRIPDCLPARFPSGRRATVPGRDGSQPDLAAAN
jgi:hypothetical protein